METVLTTHIADDGFRRIDGYRGAGGYEALRKCLTMTREAIVEEVKLADLRGRGGAGFPAGIKWGFLPKDLSRPRVLVVNADEGEPGTFKDRLLLSRAPHLLVEGIAIACYTLHIHRAYVYIRGEYVREARILQEAVGEARAARMLGKDLLGSGFDLEIAVHRGAGAYICGEETSTINSLEGKRGWPRLKPPFPAAVGAFGLPTLVNNVETLCSIPWIVTNGGKAFSALGGEKNGGTRLVGVSGPVVRPGIYELPANVNLKSVVFDVAGGLRDGMALKAVIPGGSSTPVLRADEIDVTLDIESMVKAGTMAGTCGVIVIPEGTCMVRALSVLANFYAHESCGQCTPCREGIGWIRRILGKIEEGKGRPGDVETILDICDNISGKTICAFADGAMGPVLSFIGKFRGEFDAHIAEGKCPYGNRFRGAR